MVPVDLRSDGILWMLNKTIFHPRGYALSINPDTGDLALVGDGTEPWAFEHSIELEPFRAFEALLNRSRPKSPPTNPGVPSRRVRRSA
jgi:hypothetical protein